MKSFQAFFSDHNAVRLDLNYRRKTIKNSNIWRLNNTLLNNQQITEEIKKRNQNMHRNEWKWKHNNPKPVKAVIRGRFIAIQAYLKKKQKNQINNLTFLLLTLGLFISSFSSCLGVKLGYLFDFFLVSWGMPVLLLTFLLALLLKCPTILGCCVFIFVCFYAYFDFFF